MYITASATSSAESGVYPPYTALAAASSPLNRTTLNSVSAAPGATCATWIPRGKRSMRMAWVRPCTANLDALYTAPPG